jgi:hypothetical protein
MAAQIVGVLLSVAGILWVGFTLTVLKIRNEQTEALMLLMGVVGFVGGLLLWGWAGSSVPLARLLNRISQRAEP